MGPLPAPRPWSSIVIPLPERTDRRQRISPLLDIAQGAGLAGAVGVRPFLPPLLAGALGRADVAVDFERTPFAFLESAAFLAAVLALAAASYAAARVRGTVDRDGGTRATAEAGDRHPAALATGAVAVVLGALLFGASLSVAGLEAWPGLLAGAALALAAYAATAGLLARVRRRLDPGAGALLPVWADVAALALALAAILFPPLALVGLLGLGYLLFAGRREQGRRYAGLRVLK